MQPLFRGFGAADVMQGPGAMLKENVFPVGLLPTGSILQFQPGARLNPSSYILTPNARLRLLAPVIVGYTESGRLALANTNQRYALDPSMRPSGVDFDADQLDATGEIEGSPVRAQDLLSAVEFSVPVGTRASISGGTPFELVFAPGEGFRIPGPAWIPCPATQARLADGWCGCPGNQVLLADGTTCGCPPGYTKSSAGICMADPCPQSSQVRLADGTCGCPQQPGWFTMPDGTCVAGGCPPGYTPSGSMCMVSTEPPVAQPTEEPWYKKTSTWLLIGGGVVVAGLAIWAATRKPTPPAEG